MLAKLLIFLFEKLISPIPSEEKKRKYRLDFQDLLREVAKAGAEGAVKGLQK